MQKNSKLQEGAHEGIDEKIPVTGGTTFVSKYIASYMVESGCEVYVLNRNSKPQVPGVKLIEGDRHKPGDKLKEYEFDAVVDVTAYNEEDIVGLHNSLGAFHEYIMISSSAVYPEYGVQPFTEESEIALNKFWGKYGTDKTAAEKALLLRVPDAYIIRPPYLYGPMNNVYREAFVFDCAMNDRKFYLPGKGDMKLQFFHVKDLCKLIDAIIQNKPTNHIINAGNEEAVYVMDWVKLCFQVFDKKPEFVEVNPDLNIEQRLFFPFYNYEYSLDVSKQKKILPDTIPLSEGLKEAAKWYICHKDEVNRKPLMEFIDANLVYIK